MTGQEIKGLRKRLGYNQSAFSKKIGLERNKLMRVEKDIQSLTDLEIREIKRNLLFESEKRTDLQVKVDYLKLTFFDGRVEEIMEKVIGINQSHFTYEESGKYNYDTLHKCGSILIRSQSEKMRENPKKEFVDQGILLDLTSEAISQFEEMLEVEGMSILEWLRKILDPKYYVGSALYSRVHSTRIDLAIDEMWNEENGNFDLKKIDQKYKEELLYTTLQVYQKIDSSKRDKQQGMTLTFGRRGGDGIFIRMYEKRHEMAKRFKMEVEDVLEQYGIYNRYELELGKKVNSHVFERWLSGEKLEKIAIDLLLSKIEVYDKFGVTGEKVGCKEWYDLFGNWKKVRVVNTNEEVSLDRTMRWLEVSVMPTIKFVCKIFGKESVLQWISDCIEKVDLTPRKNSKMLYEKMLAEKRKNPSFNYLMDRQADIEFEELLYNEEYEVML